MSSYGSDKHFTVTSDRDGSRSFGEHDNRWNPKYTRNKHGKGKQHYGRGRRRGGYGGGRDRRGGSGSGSGLDPRSRFEDDGDVAMEGAAGSSSRYTPYGQSSRHGTSRGRSYRSRHGGRDSRQRRSNRDISTLQKLGLPIASDHRWYKVTVPYGKKGGKDFVLKMINNLIDVPLQPIYYHHEGQSALFYVKDADAANAIKKVNKKVTMPNGFKMVVIVAPSQPPFIPMDEDTIKKLQLCMSRRYDPASRALNLSVMYEDEELKSEGLFFALNRANVMSNVIKTIQENIPELVRLDISKNRLLSLSHLTDLVSVTPDIRFLNIGKNQLRGIEELDKIQGWKLEELILDGNDLCDRFKDRNEYIR